MINKYLKTLYLILPVMLLLSCEKDEKVVTTAPIFSLLSSSDITIDTVRKASKVWEYGFRFRVTQNQSLRSVGLKLPSTGTFRIRLYDLSADTLIRQYSMEYKKEFAEAFMEVSEVNLNGGNPYGITVVADVFFKARNVKQAAIAFPISKDGIEVLSFHEEDCGTDGCARFPANMNDMVVEPCVSFTTVK